MPQHYVITPDGTVRSYRQSAIATSAALAINTAASLAGGTQAAFVATDDDLSQVPTAVLVTLHNIIRPEKPIKKFADRETAEKRMKGVLEVLAKPGEAPASTETTTEDTDMATKTTGRKRAAKKTTTTATGERAGRTSAFAGKVIRKVADANPRREGTNGYNSWELIKNGMTYEKYIAAGGRRQDLAWDLARGYVKLEKA
jgi:hypothetical protein